ncbi:hypothetical protein [Streptomyces sp. MBT62]|uniref:hypothetical protein n=1 Tax=Streptomyces sp. MBT62 TaxID=2800410 RepID=UPI001F2A8B16|nr:hypothetical protein [Streptomyces sp. MBT62]
MGDDDHRRALGGDLSVPLWGPDARDPLDVCRPLGIEVYRPDPALLAGWTPPARVACRNLHGMRRPEYGDGPARG